MTATTLGSSAKRDSVETRDPVHPAAKISRGRSNAGIYSFRIVTGNDGGRSALQQKCFGGFIHAYHNRLFLPICNSKKATLKAMACRINVVIHAEKYERTG